MLLKCLTSGKKSVEQLRPSAPWQTSALELLVFCCFRLLLVYPCALIYGMLILLCAHGTCPTPPGLVLLFKLIFSVLLVQVWSGWGWLHLNFLFLFPVTWGILPVTWQLFHVQINAAWGMYMRVSVEIGGREGGYIYLSHQKQTVLPWQWHHWLPTTVCTCKAESEVSSVWVKYSHPSTRWSPWLYSGTPLMRTPLGP